MTNVWQILAALLCSIAPSTALHAQAGCLVTIKDMCYVLLAAMRHTLLHAGIQQTLCAQYDFDL